MNRRARSAALALARGACLLGVSAACWGPRAPTVTVLPDIAVLDSVVMDEAVAPIVKVREFPSFTVVTAWDSHESAIGFSGSVARNGLPVRLHVLYVGDSYRVEPGVIRAVGLNRVLRRVRISGLYNCYEADGCTPHSASGLVIRDAHLRANPDTVHALLFSPRGDHFRLRVRPELVRAYLRAVDSVHASYARIR